MRDYFYNRQMSFFRIPSVRPQLRTGIAEKRPRSPNTTTLRERTSERASGRGLEFRPLRATLFLSVRARTKLIRPFLLFPLDKQGPRRPPCMTFVECFTFPLGVSKLSMPVIPHMPHGLKSEPVLLSNSQTGPGRKFSQPREHFLAHLCTELGKKAVAAGEFTQPNLETRGKCPI